GLVMSVMLQTPYRAKHHLHLFQTLAPRLLEQQPRIDDDGEIENGKHEKCAPANASDGVRRDLRHNEVEEPLAGGAGRDADLADARREDLADVEPWQRAPAHVEREGLEVDHDDGG